ncbi:GAP1-N2 domain-containing protein [Clostridium sp.]
MIQQQYYTRDKKGLYSDTPGYDTISKSKGLEDKLIKEVLHNYCFYEAPFELIQEENLNEYPKALMCFNIPSGEMIIGCSSFAGKDYTGQRNRYFTHNYVVSEMQKEFYIRNPDRIFNAEFKMPNSNYHVQDDYSKEPSKIFLEELIDIPIDKQSYESLTADKLFKKLGIQSSMYKKLLSACFDSVLNNRKIYIVLNVPAHDLSKYSKQLMEYIYIGLPYVVRRKFGFITYVKNSKSKEYVNLQFVAKEGIRLSSVEQSLAYVFDFQEEKYLNAMTLEKENDYLNFSWDNLGNEKVLKESFHKDDKYIKENQHEEGVSLEEYNQIFIANFHKKMPQRNEMQSCEFKGKELELDLLKDINISEISKRQIKGFVMEEKYKNNDIYMIVYYLQRILSSSVEREITLSEKKICELAYKMMPESYEISPILLKVKERIEYFYKKDISKETFRKIMIGFVEVTTRNTMGHTSEKKDDFAQGIHMNYNFQGLFNYLLEHGGIDKVRDYILWAVHDFLEVREKEVCFSFFAGLKIYIENNDSNFFKDKNFRKKLLQNSNEAIIGRIKDLELDMCVGIKKFILGLKR